MMAEKGVTAAQIGAGTGKDGRITKGDVLDFLARPAAAPAAAPAAQGRRARAGGGRGAGEDDPPAPAPSRAA